MITIKETVYISDSVSADLRIESSEGEHLDTEVNLSGEFVISGKDKDEFFEKLGDLIDSYRI